VKREKKREKGLVALITFHVCFTFHAKNLPLAPAPSAANSPFMLLFREKPPADWLPKVLANLPAVLVDHAHLERKAATSALNLEKISGLVPACGRAERDRH